MIWAVRKDGEGARRIDSESDLLDSELLSETEPDLSAKIEERLGRIWRDNEILCVQWLRDRHRDEVEIGGKTSLTADQFTELLAYIQKLRDWPESSDFPEVDKRPVRATWMLV